jgi:hypothetical protein
MLSIIHKSHKDRYRIRFCDESFYLRNQETFLLWKSLFSELNPVEKLTAWVVGLSTLRRPDWYQGKRCLATFPETSVTALLKSSQAPFRHPLTLAMLFQNTSVAIPKKLDPSLDLYQFIKLHNIKALPKVALKSLYRVAEGLYPVVITRHVPSPAELLTLQLSGQRIISVNEDTDTWATTLYSGRDYLGFLLHDLLHAEHFFAHPTHRDGQLGVYKFISRVMEDEGLNALMTANEKFRDGFEYIISDMNSHPVHMLQTLHSLLFSSLKDDPLATSVWERWIGLSGLTEAAESALHSVNTAGFTQAHAELLSRLYLTTSAQVSVTKNSAAFIHTLN